MAKGDEITTKFKVDISDLKKGITDATNQIKLADATFKAATAGMDDWTKSTEGLKAKLTQLDSTLSAQKSKLENYTEQLKRQQDAYAENGKRIETIKAQLAQLAEQGVSKTSAEYKKLETALASCEKEQENNDKSINKLKISVIEQQGAINKTTADIGKYETALNSLDSEMQDADSSTDELNKSMKETKGAAEDASDGFTVMKGALANLVSAGIQKAIEGLKNLVTSSYEAWQSYDEGADTIIAATGATGEAADELMGVYENVAKNVRGSFEDIGTAVGEVNTRFGSTGGELQTLSEKFLKFADINGLDVKTAIDNTQSALAAFGLGAEDAGNLMDVLNKAGQDTGVSLDTLTQQLISNAPALREMGMNASDSAFFIANLSKNGVDASSVMSGMKKALANAAAEGKPMSEAMAEIESSIKNASSSTDAITLATELFGAKAGPAIATAVREGKLSFEDFGTSLTDFQGNIETTYDAMQDGPDKVALAMQNLKLEAAKVFDAFLQEHGPQIEEMVNNFTENILPKVTEVLSAILDGVSWFIDNLPTLTGLIASAAAGLAAYFAYTTAIKVMKEGWMALEIVQKAVTAAQTLMNAAMNANPIGIIIGLISALVAAFIYFWNTSEDFRKFWIDLWENIKEAVSKAWKAITKWFSEAWDKIKDIWGNVGKWFSDIWDKIKKAFSKIDSWMGDKFGAAWDAVKLPWKTAVNYFKMIWENIKLIFSVVKDVLSGDFKGAWEGIKKIWDNVADFFKGIWDSVKNIFAPVGDWFKEKFTAAKEGIQNAWAKTKDWANEKWNGIKDAFSKVDSWMSDKFGGAWTAIKEQWKGVIDWFKMIWENIKLIFSVVKDVLSGDFSGAWEGIKQIWQNVGNWFSDRWEGIKNVFKDTKNWFSDKFGAAWTAIKEKFSPITKWFQGIWDGIKKIFEPVGTWFGDTFDKVKTAIKAPLNAVIKGINKVIRGLNSLSIKVPDWVPGMGGKTWGFNIGEIPELAQGGVLRRGQMGLLEGSGAEAVVPLERNKAWINAVTNELMEQLQAKGILAGSSSNISNARDYNFTQIINAPKQPSRIELYRQTRNLLAYANATGGE